MPRKTTSRRARLLSLWVLVLVGCTPGSHVFPDQSIEQSTTTVASTVTVVEVAPDQPPTTTTTLPPVTTTVPNATVYGLITTPDGEPLPGVTVDIGGEIAVTNERGRYAVSRAPFGPMAVTRPAWVPIEAEWDGTPSLDFTLEPFVVRGIRANWVVFDEDKWDSILSLADQSVVNTIVFDTKDEIGTGAIRHHGRARSGDWGSPCVLRSCRSDRRGAGARLVHDHPHRDVQGQLVGKLRGGAGHWGMGRCPQPRQLGVSDRARSRSVRARVR